MEGSPILRIAKRITVRVNVRVSVRIIRLNACLNIHNRGIYDNPILDYTIYIHSLSPYNFHRHHAR